MSLPALSSGDGIYELDLGDGEKLFTPEFVAAIAGHIEAVAADSSARALVTVAEGKVFASGLDLRWIATNADGVTAHLRAVHELYARILELPVVTIAAIQGHCFAAGAMFAWAHDRLVMREDRGYLCLPEVDLGIAFTPAMLRLLSQRLPKPALHDAVVLGRRYGAVDALAAGLISETAPQDGVGARARELAAELAGKPGATVGAIRRLLYGETIAALRDGERNRVQASDFAQALRGAPA